MANIIIKTPEQIEAIRKSAQLAAKALDYAEQFVEAGVSTAFIAVSYTHLTLPTTPYV
jgi:methionyl aminopeptidase